MAGYTKQDFDDRYLFAPERYMGGHPSTRQQVLLHYNRKWLKPTYIDPRWDAIVPLVGLTAADHVVIAGSAYGWSAERVLELVPGINIVNVDISDYIEAEKDSDDTAEVAGAITAAGLDPASGRGLEIMNMWASPGVNKAQTVVLKEEMKTVQSRNAVRQALGNNIPTYVFTEDMIQEFTDQEIAEWVTELDKLTSTVKIHVMSSVMLDVGGTIRTAQDIRNLTGHRVIVSTSEGLLEDLP